MIKEEVVQVRLNAANRKHYESFGYTGVLGEFIDVLTTHLTKSSETMITRICDTCGSEKVMRKKKAFPVCQKCKVAETKVPDSEKKGYSPCKDCGVFVKNAIRCKPCHTKYMVGENNPNFGNGDKMRGDKNPNYGKRGVECEWYNHAISQEDRLDKRQSVESINWRKAVYLKHNYTCDCCGKVTSGGSCVAHHLEGWNINVERRHDVSNGVCLCSPCHLEFHKKYGFGDNTTEQYLEFKEKHNGTN